MGVEEREDAGWVEYRQGQDEQGGHRGGEERRGQEVEMAVSKSWADFRNRMSGIETNEYFGSDPNLGTPRFSTARPA